MTILRRPRHDISLPLPSGLWLTITVRRAALIRCRGSNAAQYVREWLWATWPHIEPAEDDVAEVVKIVYRA